MTPDVKKSLALDLLVAAEERADARGAVEQAREALKQAESRENEKRRRFRDKSEAVLDAAENGVEL